MNGQTSVISLFFVSSEQLVIHTYQHSLKPMDLYYFLNFLLENNFRLTGKLQNITERFPMSSLASHNGNNLQTTIQWSKVENEHSYNTKLQTLFKFYQLFPSVFFCSRIATVISSFVSLVSPNLWQFFGPLL